VILLDANLLLYAHNTSSKEHEPTSAWLETALGTENICLSWETILAFLRIATTPRIFAEPLSLEAAVAVIDKWLVQPNVKILSATHRHWSIFSELLPSNRARGSLIMDAHLAALAIEHGATLCTNDRDFARFPGVKLEFPLQDT
jgi:uncharacterized protein